MSKNTVTDLVKELESLPPTPGIEFMIKEAKAGEYHDFRNTLYACGKMEVVNKLHFEIQKTENVTIKQKLLKIRQDVMDGEYDEPFTSEDKKFLLNETNNDPNMSEENKAFFKMAMGLEK